MDSSNSTSYTVESAGQAKALSTNQQIAQKKPRETNRSNAAGQDLSAAAFRLVKRSKSRRTRTHAKKISKDVRSGGEEELTDERAEVEKKIVTLQKIVPGGERLPVEDLFEETAEYILGLEDQVKALRFLAAFVHTSEKIRSMFGG